eukprot:2486970-Prymnesium_polylepis.1
MGPRRSAGGGSGCSSQRPRSAASPTQPQVSTPSTAHKHCTRTCTHPGGAHGIRNDVLSGARSVKIFVLRIFASVVTDNRCFHTSLHRTRLCR